MNFDHLLEFSLHQHPLLVGLFIVLLLIWQGLVRALDVPIYLVPAPTDIAHALAADWALLAQSLWFTLKITGLALAGLAALGLLEDHPDD